MNFQVQLRFHELEWYEVYVEVTLTSLCCIFITNIQKFIIILVCEGGEEPDLLCEYSDFS